MLIPVHIGYWVSVAPYHSVSIICTELLIMFARCLFVFTLCVARRDVVAALLKQQASANIADSRGCFPLHLAAWRGDAEMCRTLLTHGPSISNVDEVVSIQLYLYIIIKDIVYMLLNTQKMGNGYKIIQS